MRNEFYVLIYKTNIDQFDLICLDLNIWSCVSNIGNAEDYMKGAIQLSLKDCPIENFEPADIEYWKIALETLMCENSENKVIKIKL